MTSTDWCHTPDGERCRGDASLHPREYAPEDISVELLHHLRAPAGRACEPGAALASAAVGFTNAAALAAGSNCTGGMCAAPCPGLFLACRRPKTHVRPVCPVCNTVWVALAPSAAALVAGPVTWRAPSSHDQQRPVDVLSICKDTCVLLWWRGMTSAGRVSCRGPGQRQPSAACSCMRELVLLWWCMHRMCSLT